jgi:hypothetical protein
LGHFGSFLKNFERKFDLGIEKIQLPATQAKNKRCYLPRAPFGEVKCQRNCLLTAEVSMPY